VRIPAASLIFSLATLALCACGPRITNDNLDVVNNQREALEKVGKGLSPKEVESILGQPQRAEAFKIPLETRKPMLDGLRYFYDQDGETVELHFVDNKLISEIPKMGRKPATPPTK
jgi:hypothetical protein